MAIVCTPTYPVPGEEVTLSLTAATGTVAVFELVSGPDETELETGLLLARLPSGERVATSADDAAQLLEDGGDAALRTITFDQPGEYAFRAYDFRDVLGLPGWEGDPSGAWRRELVGTQTGTIYVGEYVELPIVTAPGHGAALRLQINNETVRAAVLIEPTTEVARVAILDSAVATALTGVVGITVANLGTQLQTGVDDLRTRYEAHRILTAAGVHADTDTTNVVDRDAVNSQEAAIEALNYLRPIVLAHAQTTGIGGGVGAPWHTVEDWKNVPCAAPAIDVPSATVVLCDLRERFYERHRVQVAAPASHGAADGTNTLTAATTLDILILAYLDAIVALDPSAAVGESEGAADAAHRYGFTRTDE